MINNNIKVTATIFARNFTDVVSSKKYLLMQYVKSYFNMTLVIYKKFSFNKQYYDKLILSENSELF